MGHNKTRNWSWTCANVNKMFKQARFNYYSQKIASFQRDSKNLFKVAKHLFEVLIKSVLPVRKMFADFAQRFQFPLSTKLKPSGII